MALWRDTERVAEDALLSGFGSFREPRLYAARPTLATPERTDTRRAVEPSSPSDPPSRSSSCYAVTI